MILSKRLHTYTNKHRFHTFTSLKCYNTGDFTLTFPAKHHINAPAQFCNPVIQLKVADLVPAQKNGENNSQPIIQFRKWFGKETRSVQRATQL
jgi:hypothetical protein